MAKTDGSKKIVADYDLESDSLSIYFSNKKSSGSIELGDIIVDFDHKKQFVGIELLNASQILSQIAKEKITKDMLDDIKSCNLKATQVGNNLIVVFTLVLPKKKVVEETIPVPLISGQRPTAIA